MKDKSMENKIIKLLQDGLGDKEIAKTLGVSMNAVGVVRRANKAMLDNVASLDLGKIRVLSQAGWSVGKIADEFCMSVDEFKKAYNQKVSMIKAKKQEI